MTLYVDQWKVVKIQKKRVSKCFTGSAALRLQKVDIPY